MFRTILIGLLISLVSIIALGFIGCMIYLGMATSGIFLEVTIPLLLVVFGFGYIFYRKA